MFCNFFTCNHGLRLKFGLNTNPRPCCMITSAMDLIRDILQRLSINSLHKTINHFPLFHTPAVMLGLDRSLLPCGYPSIIFSKTRCGVSRCSMGFIVLVMCGLRRLRIQMKTTSRLTATVLRVCVATLLLTHACRTLIRNSVWHDRRSLFTYVTMRFADNYVRTFPVLCRATRDFFAIAKLPVTYREFSLHT